MELEHFSQLNIVAQYWPVARICKYEHIKGVHPTKHIATATGFPRTHSRTHTHTLTHFEPLQYIFDVESPAVHLALGNVSVTLSVLK